VSGTVFRGRRRPRSRSCQLGIVFRASSDGAIGMNLDDDTRQDDLVTSELGLWEPLSIDAVNKLLQSATVPWWIAGGWAIDLHLGRRSRAHADVDVVVLRPHLQDLRCCLAGWDLYAADPPGTLVPWPAETSLPSGVHDVWCRPSRQHPWQLQLMVDNLAANDDTAWVYRRDERIRRPSANPDRTGLAARATGAHTRDPTVVQEPSAATERSSRLRCAER